MRHRLITLLPLIALVACQPWAGAPQRGTDFNFDWRFQLGDEPAFAEAAYDDGAWRELHLPHDWSVEGEFSAENPSTPSGGALPGGIGWYRKHFTVPESLFGPDGAPQKAVNVEFDGVFMNSTVYVNGQEFGTRPYGYSSFCYDITGALVPGENVIAVRCDNADQPNSRWYAGCGIYRNVRLVETDPVHVAYNGVYARAVDISRERATVVVDVETAGTRPGMDVSYDVRILNAKGRTVASATALGAPVFQTKLTLRSPHFWDIDDTYLYTAQVTVSAEGQKDTYSVRFGVRTTDWDADKGFSLNGRPLKMLGVCLHHDMGCLGTAVHRRALQRELQILKDMGVNAIRTSHNPPAPELLDLCDEMGFVVMDEAMDMWRRRKTRYDYARFFDEWHERDLTDLVVRDRNHPCILMWSIGNEVLEQWGGNSRDDLTLEQANLLLNASRDASTLAKDGEMSPNSLLTLHLADIIKRNDGEGRPILAGCNEPSPNNHLFKSGAIDIIGFNYHHQWVKDVPKNFPGKPFIFSESVSALQTRGYYKMPSDEITWAPQEWYLPYTDPSFMCSSYDNFHASWSSTHEETWDVVKHTPYVGGQYIWTGWDYIGEPTPYGFPARSSYFGIIDLAGFPKDSYYMYQSEWTSTPVLHLFPHWNWVPGDEIDMWCYYNNADEVELFINGKSQGVRRKTAENPEHRYDRHNTKTSLNTEYHVGWRVVFDPGEVKVVARKDGKVVGQQTIKTAGPPAKIRLSKDYQGKTTTFITAEVVDKDGNLCPWAEDQIVFIGEGTGRILGTDNGCQTSMERFTSPQRKAFFGKCMVVVTGKGSITAKSPTLQADVIEF